MKFKKIQQFTFLSLLAVVSMAFLWVISDFLMPIFWAIVIGIIFYPVYEKLNTKVNNSALSSVVTIAFILIACFVPLSFVGGLVVSESVSLYQQLSIANPNGTVDLFEKSGEAFAFFEKYNISEYEIREKLTSIAQTATSWLGSQAVSVGTSTFSFAMQLFIMIYLLFFILKDGKNIQDRLLHIMPLGEKREKRLIVKFTSITRAAIKGTLVVGVIQGTIGGIIFFIAGIGSSVLWGVLMTILSVIPAVGTIIVWLPAGIILLATGSIWQGLFILIGGLLIIGLVDNILRPILIGKDTKMPDALVLISTLGGLSVFGITGFVIGPVIAGFFMAMWNMFEEEYHKQLIKHG